MSIPKKGFVPVMLTPFKNDGSIDYHGLTLLTNFYLESGASGLFANCLSSEMYYLTEAESLSIIKHVIAISAGKVPVVATGTLGGNLQKQAETVKKVHDLGVDAVIGITSLLASDKDTEDTFLNNALHLLEQTEKIPMGFYECPVPYKRVISPKHLGELVKTGRVVYHKDTCLDIEQIKEKLKVTSGYNFGLYDAYMAHAVASLEAGSAGLSCIQGNYFPELVVWLCDNFNKPSMREQVALAQQFFIENMVVMHDVYPITAKYYLSKIGLNISTFTRLPISNEFTNLVKNNIDLLALNYEQLRNTLEIKSVIC